MVETGETSPVDLKPGVYRIVPDRSVVRISVRGIAGTIAAELPVQSGVFVIDAEGRIAEVRTVMDPRGLKAGRQTAVRALTGRSGLDVARFETMAFASTAASSNGAALDVEGTLTMRGVSHPARFRGEITQATGRRLAVRLQGTVDRLRYGITVGRPLYAKEATVRIRVVARRENRG